MFGRDDKRKEDKKPAARPDDAAVSISPDSSHGSGTSSSQPTARSKAMIGQSIKIKGTIEGAENLVIDGTVEGSVSLPDNDLTIGDSGQVTADLQAKTVKVDGQVTGDISGSEKVIISKSGRVKGNIVAPRVTLEDGAKFKGSIDMDPGENSKPTAVKPAIEKAPEPKQEAS